ncbi:MAG: hypothetical protein HKN67_14105, partial [Saprospiraceae bacterium]|nr:hypothetical protein [Saprospiraceae bacterium]
HVQIIKSTDNGNPTIDVSDVTASVDPWECSADVSLPHPEHLADDCDDNITYSIGAVSGGLQVVGDAVNGYILQDVPKDASVNVEYLAEDCCGNIGRNTISVSVVDLTAPVPVTKEFIVLSLTNIGNPVDEFQGIAKIFAEDVDNGSYDGCTSVDFSIRRVGEFCSAEDTLWGESVKFCCEDLEGQTAVDIDVEFRVMDTYGNTNYAWSTIKLEDKSGTTQTCPEDMILSCDMDYNDFTMTGLPKAFAACGEIDLQCDLNELIEDTEPRRKGPNDGFFNDPRYDGVEVPAYDPSCGYGAIRRQFKSCSSCTQWFVIEPIDAFDPSTITFPEDQTVDCDGFETGEPEWEPATCNLVGVSVVSDTFLFEDGACYKILNHWSVINWCTYDPADPGAGGKYDYTQVIKIIDTQDPQLTVADSLHFAVDADCSSSTIELSAMGNDEGLCGSDWLKWEVTIDIGSDWTSDYEYGTDKPRLVNGTPNPYHISPTGNNQEAVITLPAGIASSNTWHRSVWRLYDGCGNNVSSVRYFQVTDKKVPTPYCLNLSTAVMSSTGDVELWAIDFNVGSFDNCTSDDNLNFTFSDVAPPPRDDTEYDSSSDLMWYNGTFWYFDSETGDYMDQDDYGDEVHRWEPGLRSAGKVFTIDDADATGIAQVPIYVWDEDGNKDFCLVNLRLIDNQGVGEGRIAGQVLTDKGEAVEGVTAELMGNSPEFPILSTTDQFGEYAFDHITHLEDYQVTAYKTDGVLDGVSTLDLLLIQKHILGQQPIESPYKLVAADINNDKEITAIDLIELRKTILGVNSVFPGNTSWKMLNAFQDLSVDNVWSYKETLEINDLSENLFNENFIAVKIGDVNGSIELQAFNADEYEEKMIMSYEDRYVKAGEMVELSLQNNAKELYGFQFTMNTEGLEFIDVFGNDLNDSNIGVFENQLTVSFHSLDPVMDKEEAVKFVFEAMQDGLLSDILSINSSVTKSEAYLGKDLQVVNIALQNNSGNLSFNLYQNQPNPFNEYTLIGFDLPEAGAAQLTLYNVTGQLIKSMKLDGVAGYNEVKIFNTDIESGGLIYYQLETKEHTAVKHMIIIE